MTGSITAEILAAGPDIHWAIRQAGQDLTILRPGQPAAQARAFLYPLDDKAAGQRDTQADFKVTAWQGIFLPDAPVRERGFVIQDAQGRLFWPDGDVQDVGEQGVALIAHLLPLPERTRTEYLTFQVAGPLVKDPRTGNLRPGAGQAVSVPVRLFASADPAIRDLVGADAASVAFVGRWGTLLDPQGKPAGVNWGLSSPLVVDGQPGTLTIKLAYPDADTVQEVVLGARFVALWKAGV